MNKFEMYKTSKPIIKKKRKKKIDKNSIVMEIVK